MQQLNRSFRFGAGMFAAILLAVLIAACARVNVQCPSGGQDDGGPPGACNPKAYEGSAVGFYNTATGMPIPSGSPLTCLMSNKCKGVPGQCGFTGGNCKSTFTPTSGNNGMCSCGCPPS